MHILVHVAGYLAYVVPVPTVLVCLVVFGFLVLDFWLLAFWLAPLTFVTFVLPPTLPVARLVALSASRAAQQRVFLIQAVMPKHVWFSPIGNRIRPKSDKESEIGNRKSEIGYGPKALYTP